MASRRANSQLANRGQSMRPHDPGHATIARILASSPEHAVCITTRFGVPRARLSHQGTHRSPGGEPGASSSASTTSARNSATQRLPRHPAGPARAVRQRQGAQPGTLVQQNVVSHRPENNARVLVLWVSCCLSFVRSIEDAGSWVVVSELLHCDLSCLVGFLPLPTAGCAFLCLLSMVCCCLRISLA